MVFMVLGAYAQLKLTFSDTFVTNFFWLAVTRPEPVHRGVRVRVAAFRHQHRADRPGRGGSCARIGLHAVGHADHPAAGVPRLGRASRQYADRVAEELHGGRAASVATETSSLMSTMIEFHPDVIVQIFLIFAFGYVILIIPIGMLTTYLSNKLAVRR